MLFKISSDVTRRPLFFYCTTHETDFNTFYNVFFSFACDNGEFPPYSSATIYI